MFITANYVSAATVSILIIETGQSDKTEIAGFWETGMMDALFEMGHIVSNAPAVQIPKFDDKEIPLKTQNDFEEAERSDVDYFIIAQLDYPEAGKQGTEKALVALKLYKIRPYGVLYTGKYEVDAGNTPLDKISKAKDAARLLARYMGNG
ncbi:MAG: hypothetical protein LBH18_01620 [Spirochaetaceae bacterium]|nr:hypothetical protein [Spirochaetaceae bacterium]